MPPFTGHHAVHPAPTAHDRAFLCALVDTRHADFTAQFLHPPLDLFGAFQYQPPFLLYCQPLRFGDEVAGQEVRVGLGGRDVQRERTEEGWERGGMEGEGGERGFGGDGAVGYALNGGCQLSRPLNGQGCGGLVLTDALLRPSLYVLKAIARDGVKRERGNNKEMERLKTGSECRGGGYYGG